MRERGSIVKSDESFVHASRMSCLWTHSRAFPPPGSRPDTASPPSPLRGREARRRRFRQNEPRTGDVGPAIRTRACELTYAGARADLAILQCR
jgi:hypothetical protein